MATGMSSQVQSRRASPKLQHSESLASIISQAGPLPEEQVWSVIDQLLQRAESLHEQGKCHRCFSLSTIGIDASGELEIATTDSALSISEIVRLHAPLPSCLRHEFDLVLPRSSSDASISLSHAGFGGDATALDLFQIAVLAIKLIFDVDSEKFLASPCLHETLSPELCQTLKQRLSANGPSPSEARAFRALLPGAMFETTPIDVKQTEPEELITPSETPEPELVVEHHSESEIHPVTVAESPPETVPISTLPIATAVDAIPTLRDSDALAVVGSPTLADSKQRPQRSTWTVGLAIVALIAGLVLVAVAVFNLGSSR